MDKDTTYKIFSGTPDFVSDVCNKFTQLGWSINGELFITKVGDNIVAFQGMLREPRKKDIDEGS